MPGRSTRLICVLAVLASVLGSIGSRAAWHEASSEHFVVYADQSYRQVLRYTEKLERFHAALRTVVPGKGLPPSPSNRVTVYVVRGARKVKELYGDKATRYLNGFYRGRAGGSIAIVPRISGTAGSSASRSEQTLLHEYAHHYMYSNTERLLPRWYVEGFAEFYATARFGKDGSVGLGLPAHHRAWELGEARHVPIEELLDTQLYLKNKSSRYDNFYGRSWLLYHYLFFATERHSQVRDYVARLQRGEKERNAALASFGDLTELNRELRAYLRRHRLTYIDLPADMLPIKPVAVRRLSEGEAAVLPIATVSRLGVSVEKANELLPQVRAVAAKYPDSAFVFAALAEAEVDAHNYDQAIVAADASMRIDSTNMRAHIQKGYALAHIAAIATKERGDEARTSAAWSAARRQFMQANKLETENPLPLVHFYRTYLRQGIEPTRNAVEGLEWALSLAPFDSTVRWLVAKQQMTDERYAEARATLVPLAFGPHRADDNRARRLYDEAGAKLAEATELARVVPTD